MVFRVHPRTMAVLIMALPVCAQEPAAWTDPSPHNVQFVTVDENVRLEVLDWGGSGRPLVFIPGLGNTAHVFDGFAPKFIDLYHVYGITRRGFGASSAPATGYDSDRLGDDALAVLDSLKLDRPVLVGHSLGGEELSSIGSRHPDRVAALIYLDAGYSYAFDNGKGMTVEAQQELTKSPPPMGPLPTAADRVSFPAMLNWYERSSGIKPPEAEVRQTFIATPEGHVGMTRTPLKVPPAIIAGFKKITDIRAPVLAIYAIPKAQAPWLKDADPQVRTAVQTFMGKMDALTEKQVKAFENGVPRAKVVRIANANHYVFLSNEADTLREMRAFLAGLK
jgi:pimeloyl-ACP methyl ester carboxylesterase